MPGELITCVNHDGPVMFVILNDGRYRMVDAGLVHIFGRRSPGLPGNDGRSRLGRKRLRRRGCGRVRAPRDLEGGRLGALLAMRRPVLLDVRIDPSELLSTDSRLASLKHFSEGGTK